MGFCARIVLVISVITAVFFGYRFYQPVPAALINPNGARSVAFGFNTANLAADVASTLGISSWSATFRNVFHLMIRISDTLSSKPPRDKNVIVTNRVFDGVTVRMYDPPGGDANRPVVIYIHGGGWVLLTPAHYDPQMFRLVKELGALVVSIDYRLKKFPIPFEDCRRAATFFLRNIHKFNVNPDKIAIAGDSAGGNLAAAIAQHLAQLNLPHKPKLQALIYPALQAFDLDSPSYQENLGILLTRDSMIKFYLAHAGVSMKHVTAAGSNRHISTAVKTSSKYAKYVSRSLLPARFNTNKIPFKVEGEDKNAVDELEKIVLDARFSPLLADNLKGLPKTLMVTCEYDPLRDDGFMYVARLQDAGVSVKHVHLTDLIHGGIFYDPQIFQQVIAFLKQNL
ncbi:arylacetamide deacetylase-like [Tubulanus polymorphus]|uniref:arylacetamide deacetylase-like n=1 Tax=Tubulanus polymorphus TaxID=672921 RepID=UPI003DA1E495